jgi:hypothetical protein
VMMMAITPSLNASNLPVVIWPPWIPNTTNFAARSLILARLG